MNGSKRVVWLLFFLSFAMLFFEQTRFTVSLYRTMLAGTWFFVLLDGIDLLRSNLRERKKP